MNERMEFEELAVELHWSICAKEPSWLPEQRAELLAFLIITFRIMKPCFHLHRK